jgi:hypothetical protein
VATVRPETAVALIDAIAKIRGFTEARAPDSAMSPDDRRVLERLFDRYQRADEAFGREIEEMIRAATSRPRR